MSGYIPAYPWANGRASGLSLNATRFLTELDNMGDYVEGLAGGALSVLNEGTTSGVKTLDMSNRQECLWIATINNLTAFQIIGMAAGDSVTLVVKQDAVGNRGYTLPSAYWDDGAVPTGSTGANAKDIRGFFSDGTFMYAFDSGTGMALA